jgi:hypothetical protein
MFKKINDCGQQYLFWLSGYQKTVLVHHQTAALTLQTFILCIV